MNQIYKATIIILFLCAGFRTYSQINLPIAKQAEKFIASLKANDDYPVGGRDTLIDLNGDKQQDILIEFYGAAGTGFKNAVRVFLFDPKRKNFFECRQLNEMANPTFYFDKKIVTSYYMANGGGGGVKLKWNGFKLDSLEYIEIDAVSRNGLVQFDIVRYDFVRKKKYILKNTELKLPKEYRFLEYTPLIKKP